MAGEIPTEIRHIVEHFDSEKVKIKITRGQKGGVGWEIDASAASVDRTIQLLTDAKEKVEKAFVSQNAPLPAGEEPTYD